MNSVFIIDSPLNRMLRALPRLRRRISRRKLLLLCGVLLFLAVALFYIISFSRFKPVTTTEPLSLPEEFLTPFHTRVCNLYCWLISETLLSTLRKSLQNCTRTLTNYLSFRVFWLIIVYEPFDCNNKSRKTWEPSLFSCSQGQIFHIIKNWIIG